ncbi:MAG: glycosyltransferase family 4 protein [Methylobacteriaceae bacterium]|nr:glycosyltransferase family 4 protein [Methylobacteriaceae bacterium]
MARATGGKLKILHVLRAPVGGLFRHVLDLTKGQIERGHAVGLVTDSTTGGARADEALRQLEPKLELGLSRVPMARNPGFADVMAMRHVAARLAAVAPDVAHGHGSKGGVYARVGASLRSHPPVRAYTPHGGSFNYRPGTTSHRLYMSVEGALRRATDLYLFESAYIQSRFHQLVGPARAIERVVLNGISPQEFMPITPTPGAADFLYVGELRSAKGIDILLAALAAVSRARSGAPRLTLVGSGPDEAMLTRAAIDLGVGAQVSFAGAMPARQAFALGRMLIVPSRAESLPYVVLEAAGASIPMIATDVGGIPEIFGPYRDRLIAANAVEPLARRMAAALADDADDRAAAQALAGHVATHFALDDMIDGVIEAYRDALAARQTGRAPAPDRDRAIRSAAS